MAGISKTKYSSQYIDNMSFDDDLKVSMVEIIGQDGVLKNPATETKQDTLQSLIETLQELNQRLAPLGSAIAQVGGQSLKVSPGGATLPISGSVTASGGGYITSAQSIAEKAIGGVRYDQRIAIDNLAAIQSNINNITT